MRPLSPSNCKLVTSFSENIRGWARLSFSVQDYCYLWDNIFAHDLNVIFCFMHLSRTNPSRNRDNNIMITRHFARYVRLVWIKTERMFRVFHYELLLWTRFYFYASRSPDPHSGHMFCHLELFYRIKFKSQILIYIRRVMFFFFVIIETTQFGILNGIAKISLPKFFIFF